MPERGCSWFREKPNDFAGMRASNRVGKNDRLWHTVSVGEHDIHLPSFHKASVTIQHESLP